MVEDAVDAVRDYLIANLAAHITAVNAQMADTITIIEPKSYEVAEVPTMKPTPFCIVTADDSKATNDKPTYFQTRHSITIILVESDQNTNTLRRKLYRQVLAVVKAVIAGEQAGTLIAAFWRDSYAQYSPIYAVGSTFHADAQVYIEVMLEENY